MNFIYKLRLFTGLSLNYFIDYYKYLIESGLLNKSTEIKLLAYITYTYHTLEKGFSMPQLRLGFGKKKVELLLANVLLYIEMNYDITNSQFIAACSVLKKYYDLNIENKYDVHSYFPRKYYVTIASFARDEIGGVVCFKKEEYFAACRKSFPDFIKSRHSIRYFTKEIVDIEKIKSAVELANHCPSACNRQSSKVYLINKQEQVDRILKIQKGVTATADQIHQLIVVTSNRSYFFTSGERNQIFVDGGIFLESLLLSLHNENIATCTLHWSLNRNHDKAIESVVGLSKGEKVIALLAIGHICDDFKVPYSFRKSVDELLVIRN